MTTFVELYEHGNGNLRYVNVACIRSFHCPNGSEVVLVEIIHHDPVVRPQYAAGCSLEEFIQKLSKENQNGTIY